MSKSIGNFKSSLFGGFNREDVAAYIEKLAAERNSLQEDNTALCSKIEELEDNLSAERYMFQEENAALNEKIAELESVISENDIRQNDEEKVRKCTEILDETRKIMAELVEKYKAVRLDLNINIAHSISELERISGHTAVLNDALDDTENKLTELAARINSEEFVNTVEE